jgi:outer membrane receptor for ferrienterochelin and colicins
MKPAASASSLLPFALVLLGGAAPALAQSEDGRDEERLIEQLDLQTLLNTPVDVWTPSKAPQKSYQAPSIITTVTREQIAVWGYRSLAELLGHLVGFYLVDDHANPTLAVRGNSGGLASDSSTVKVLINGHPISFAPTGGNWLGPELIPLTAIERVEVIRGPVSALYGADAFLGLINIQTREGDSADGGSAWVALGRVGHKLASDVDVSLGSRRGKFEGLVGFRRAQQDLSGLRLPPSSPAPNIPRYNAGATTASGLDQESTSAVATFNYHSRPGRSSGLFAYYSALERGSEFGSLLQLANGYNERNAFSENRVQEWQARVGAHHEQDLTSRLKLALRGAYWQGGTGDDDRLEVGSEFYYVRRRLGFRGGDFDGHLEWNPGSSFTLAGGASGFLDDERLPSRTAIAKRPIAGVARGDVIGDISVYQGRKKFLGAGAYAQCTWQGYDGRLALTGGLRYDRHNVYGGQLSRRIGVVGSPRPNLHLKLLHGSAFQAPSPFLLYAVPSTSRDVVGNPLLRPQYVNTFELQVEYQLGGVLRVASDLAYSLLDDKTEFIQQGINKEARNVARTSSLSWENELEVKVREWLNVRISFELQRTALRTGQDGYAGQITGNEGSIYPRAMVHGGLVGQLGRLPARLAIMASYIGIRRASENNILLNGSPYSLPPYWLLDANLSTHGFRILRHPDQEISFSVSGKNLLGATGPTPGFSGVDYPLAPRALFVQMNLTQ